MRKPKHSDGMTYMGANFMPDYRFGYSQIGDVLNLFCRRNINLTIHSDGFSVFLQHHLINGTVKGLVHTQMLIISFFGILLYECASRALDFVRLRQ